MAFCFAASSLEIHSPVYVCKTKWVTTASRRNERKEIAADRGLVIRFRKCGTVPFSRPAGTLEKSLVTNRRPLNECASLSCDVGYFLVIDSDRTTRTYMAMAESIARTCRISRCAIPCLANLPLILMHRDYGGRNRGVPARKVEIELQRLQPPRYSQVGSEAYFRTRLVRIHFCRRFR